MILLKNLESLMIFFDEGKGFDNFINSKIKSLKPSSTEPLSTLFAAFTKEENKYREYIVKLYYFKYVIFYLFDLNIFERLAQINNLGYWNEADITNLSEEYKAKYEKHKAKYESFRTNLSINYSFDDIQRISIKDFKRLFHRQRYNLKEFQELSGFYISSIFELFENV